MPAFCQPAFGRVYRIQFYFTVFRHFIRQSQADSLFQKQSDVCGCFICHIKMSPSCITQKRNATFRIHHAESQCRIYPGFPPFIFSFNHQSGYPVDITGTSPFQMLTPVAGQVRTRSIAVQGDDGQGTFRIPCGKVPGISSHGRMAYGHDRDIFQFAISADVCQVGHHFLEYPLCAFRYIPLLVDAGCYPYKADSQLLHLLAEKGIVKKSFFAHIVLSYKNCFHLHTVGGYPQESRRIPVRFVGDESVKSHRPLPLSCPQAGREVKQEDY